MAPGSPRQVGPQPVLGGGNGNGGHLSKIEDAMEMLRQGNSVSEVAERFKTTARTVRRWRQARFPRGMSTNSPTRAAANSASESPPIRTDDTDGHAGTDTVYPGSPEPAGDQDPFAKDPEIVAVRRKAAIERAEAERLRAALERKEAEGALREAVEREGLRLQAVRRVEKDAHRRTSEALRRYGDADVEDFLLLTELAAWHWQRYGGERGRPFTSDSARAAAWAKGYGAAMASDPSKPGGQA